MAADVTDEQALHSLARRVLETFGRIDVWVNNAAVTLFARFERAPAQAFRQVIETNFFGHVHGARAVLPIFREQGSGTLINISSGVGKLGGPFISAYAASKDRFTLSDGTCRYLERTRELPRRRRQCYRVQWLDWDDGACRGLVSVRNLFYPSLMKARVTAASSTGAV